ncbi:MAG: hypothetical protein JNG84_02115 [Archangium sp.]|nr:hypothetical protein [Archangium sp.]
MSALTALFIIGASVAEGAPKRRGAAPAPAPRAAPAAAPTAAPTAAPEAASPGGGGGEAGGGAPGVRGPTRIDFDDRLIQGQSNKSGSVYLYDRKELKIRSMIKKRENFRDEIIGSLYDS